MYPTPLKNVDMAYQTLKELYIRSVERFPDRACSSMYEGESLTYRDFALRVEKVTGILKQGGLVRGDRMALLSNNMPNWGVCYFAAVCSGIIVVPILPDFSPEQLGRILKHSGAKALFVSDKLFSKVPKNIVDQFVMVVRTVNLGIISHVSIKSEAIGLKQALSGITQNDATQGISAEDESPVRLASITDITPEDVAAIIYTSGTTSEPKGVMLTHGNLAAQVAMDDDLFPICEDDIFLSILPLSHTYECSLGMLLPFSQGAHVVYLDRQPTPSTLMPALKAVRPTIMLSVPLIIEKIYRSQVRSRFTKHKWIARIYRIRSINRFFHKRIGKRMAAVFGGRLRFFGIGGAKLDALTERYLRDSHFPYAIGYGLTETGPLLSGAVPGRVRYRSAGPLLNGVQGRIENPDPESGEGELVVLSPSTMKGYYEDPAATAAAFTPDGWFRTRDIARFDGDGNLFVIGRTDNMITGPDGENIYPEEIETVINSHFLVTDSIVKRDRDRLVAFVKFDKDALDRKFRGFKDGMKARMAGLKGELKSSTNSKLRKGSQIAEIIEQENDFDRTPTHKINRHNNDVHDVSQQTGGSGADHSGEKSEE